MNRSEQHTTSVARCVLCAATCELSLLSPGPDQWRTEVAAGSGGGLCPRGSALAELATHRRRILQPRIRSDGGWRELALADAADAILARATDGQIVFLADGQWPLEQLGGIAAWCAAWPGASLCVVVEPAERDLLWGLEASGCAYPPQSALAECDGFLLIGDVFAANPACSRGAT